MLVPHITDELLKQRKKLHSNWTMLEWGIGHAHVTYFVLALRIVPSAIVMGLVAAG